MRLEIRAAVLVAAIAMPAQADIHSPTTATLEPAEGVDELVARTTLTGVSAAVSGSEKGTKFTVNFVPAQFFDFCYFGLLSEAKVSAVADSASSLTRVTLSTGYNPYSLRSTNGDKIIKKNIATYPCSPPFIGKETYARCTRRRQAKEWEQFNSIRPAVTAALSIDLYPWGSGPDPDDSSMTARLEPWGGISGQIGLESHPTNGMRLSLWGTTKHIRASGGAGTKLARTLGGGVTFSLVALDFLPSDLADSSNDYIQTGLLPGLVVGASLQGSDCDGDTECVKARTREVSVTPFIDLVASSKLQFRISFPFTRFETASETNTEIVPTFSVASTLGTP
jgi:hypothetical protein